ncbi:MAG: hypothetical protein JW909_07540 [Planctomycetes bacterium]|nr:hypothetical protein [Planctomycetota bacterium]
MYRKIALLILMMAPLSGCYLIAPFPGGYVAVDVPPVGVRVGTDVRLSWGLIPGTAVYYSSSYPDILYYNSYYYYTTNGAWYMSTSHMGPWRVVQSVPDAFLYIPQTHAAFHVVRWHPRYRHVYRNAPPSHYTAPPHYTPPPASPAGPAAPAPSATPVVPKKGKPGKQEDETPAAPPGTWHRQ